MPAVPPLLSVKVKLPLAEPRAVGAKLRFSLQLLPGLIEAPGQFCVVTKGDVAATPEITSGALPILLIVTGRFPLVVPIAWFPKVMLDGDTDAIGVPAYPVST